MIKNPILGLVWGLIGILIGNRLAIGRDKINRFTKVADTFRDTFRDEIRFIDRFYAVDRAGKDIPDVLATAVDKQEHAFACFIEHLCCIKRFRIKKAWKTYTGEDKHMGKYTFKQYSTVGKFKDAERIRNLVLKRIKKLLKFAEPG